MGNMAIDCVGGHWMLSMECRLPCFMRANVVSEFICVVP